MDKRQTKKIRARIGPKVLANVGRYFTNDLAVIATELLQNCRRAGASAVTVTIDQAKGEIVVADNGRGLSAEAAFTLLTFGGSSNVDIVEFDEAPAGMGFFSLALRGVRVRSQDWEMVVPPSAFTGFDEAELTAELDQISGMIVAFPADLGRGTERHEAAAVFLTGARFMAFQTRVDGIEATRTRITDWLHAMPAAGDGITAPVDVIEAMVGDCAVTIARFEDGAERWVRRGRPLSDRNDEDDWIEIYVELFGKVIRVATELMVHYAPVLAAPAEENMLRLRDEESVRWPIRPGYMVVLEALGHTTIKSRLPDRDALVRSPELGVVFATIVDLVAELAARAERNSVAPDGWPRLVAARSGLDISPPQVRAFTSSAGLNRGFALESGRVRYAQQPTLGLVAEGGDIVYRLGELGPDDTLLQVVDPEPMLEQVLLRSAFTNRVLVCHGGALDGIERILGTVLVAGEMQIVLDVGPAASPSEQRSWPAGVRVANDLALEIATSQGRRLLVPIDFIVGGNADDSGIPPIITRESASIGAIMREAAPAPGDWPDAERMAKQLRRHLTTAMRSHAQTVAEVIRDALLDAGLTDTREGVKITAMHAARDDATEITHLTVTASDGSNATLSLDPATTMWSD